MFYPKVNAPAWSVLYKTPAIVIKTAEEARKGPDEARVFCTKQGYC